MFKNFFESAKYILKKAVTSRIFILSIFLFSMYGALIYRLFYLQIIQGEGYQENFTEQTTVTVNTDYTRGQIFDRKGNLLAYNKLAYNVTIMDTGDYTAYERNLMILRLIEILNKHGETINSSLSIALDDDENYVFTTTTESGLTRFLKDIYGDEAYKATEKSEGKKYSDYTADEVIDKLINRYGVGYKDSSKKETYELDKETTLKLLNIRYSLALNSYRKYISSTVAVDVSEETVSDIMEHAYNLLGVSIGQESMREYTDAKYFSHIIGYTGSASQEELDSLKKTDTSYSTGDIVGKTGIEYSMESTLKGIKGSKTISIDVTGTLVKTQNETEAVAGNDVYLTIDSDLTKATYAYLEQHLAAILLDKIVNYPVKITDDTVASKIKIPIKDVYFQLINNNVLSMSHFSSDEATTTEKDIYDKFTQRKEEAINKIGDILLDTSGKNNDAYSDEYQEYISYTYNMLTDQGILATDKVDTSDSTYKKWVDDKIGLHDFLTYALSKSWIDVTKLDLSSQYSTSDEAFKKLIKLITNDLDTDSSFYKKVYQYLIEDGTVTGNELCLALFDQSVLAYDETEYNKLSSYSTSYAYTFIKKKIEKLELTPAQLALDPCSGSVVVTNVKTGDILALVSYPSYDNNEITVNNTYLNQLNVDQSAPLYNRATQTKIAPGSTFKMITAFAGMEEGVLKPTGTITSPSDCIFDKSNIKVKCAISPNGSHGTLNIQGALLNSCNYFFCEIGYRLSQNSKGNYSSSIGLAKVQKYTEMFGFGEKTGIEISEASPHVTQEDPVQSSIGQGSHAYTNTQMNRYVTSLAAKGEVLKLNLVKKTVDTAGETITKSKKEVIRKLDFPDDEWNAVLEGMHDVINQSKKYKTWFSAVPVTVAGKTGTAQENKKRANHANFVSFAPYDNPEISVSVSIPYGYTAANSVSVARDVINYYFSDLKVDDVLNQTASDIKYANTDD